MVGVSHRKDEVDRSPARKMERATGKGHPAHGARRAGGIQGRLERRELSRDYRNIACHGHEGFAGPRGNGGTRPHRAIEGHSLPVGYLKGLEQGRPPAVTRKIWVTN